MSESEPTFQNNPNENLDLSKKQEIRKFSKEYSPDERQQTATEIKFKRKEYFERKNDLFEEIELSKPEELKSKDKLSELNKEIEVLTNELSQKRKNKVIELLSYLQIKNIQKNLGKKKIILEQFEDEYVKNKNLISELSSQMDDKSKLEEAKNKLNEFYNSQNEKLDVFENEKLKQLENVVDKYDVVFIHGIHPHFTPKTNSPLKIEHLDAGGPEKTVEEKLKILLALEPTIASSTIGKNDTPQNMWCRMGVLLNGGKIIEAYSSDAGSKSRNVNERTTNSHLKDITIKNQIHDAIIHRAPTDHGAYNEMILQNPTIAGFYVDKGKPRSGNEMDLIRDEEIAKIATKYNLPLYVISNGETWEAYYHENTKTIYGQKLIKPSEITKTNPPTINRDKIVSEIFEDCPFKETSHEIHQLESMFDGQEYYLALNAFFNKHQLKNNITQRFSETLMDKEYSIGQLEDFNKIAALGNEIQYQYLIKEKESHLIKLDKNIKTGEIRNLNPITSMAELRNGKIRLGENGYIDENFPIINNRLFLKAINNKINEYYQNSLHLNENTKKEYENIIKNLVFFIYGYGEQAKDNNDLETYQNANELANKYLSTKDYQDTIKKRLKEDGSFKILPEDMGVNQ